MEKSKTIVTIEGVQYLTIANVKDGVTVGMPSAPQPLSFFQAKLARDNATVADDHDSISKFTS